MGRRRIARNDRFDFVDWFPVLAIFGVAFGIVQFVQGIWQAIHYYPEPYSLFDRFLSELGREGQHYTISRSLFTRSTVVLGISLLPFLH